MEGYFAERDQPPVAWTAGQEDVRLWIEGVRPNYSLRWDWAGLTLYHSRWPFVFSVERPGFHASITKVLI